jgi:hypothetical protein
VQKKIKIIFSLLLCFAASVKAQILTNSILPIVKINTLGNNIQDDPKVLTHISVINNVGINNINDPANDLISYAGIEFRGSSSQAIFPKKSYGIELRDSFANTLPINKSFLGMPPESDWILYAPYTDKTFLRDALTYTLARQMGQYASRCKFVELVVNGNYEGIYIAQEKIKRDSNRVNIAKLLLTDISGAELTGGYILKIDKPTGTFNGGFNSSITSYLGNAKNTFFQFDYPSTPNVQQQNYISSYVDSFENALLSPNWKDPNIGYNKFINTNSFIDFFLLNELSHNVDGYRLSTYLHKKKITNGDGKLHMGPVWDFNLAYENADYCDGWRTDSWAYQQPCDQSDYPFWWDRLLLDTNYTNKLKCNYLNYRANVLSNANIFNTIDSMVNKIGTAATMRNYSKWPIIGTYVWPNYYVANSYNEELDSLKSWITQRLNWMDVNMPGNPCAITPNSLNETLIDNMEIYPTIAQQEIYLKYATNKSFDRYIEIYSVDGKLIEKKFLQFSYHQSKNTIDISSLSSGAYFLICKNQNTITKSYRFFKH